MHSLLDAIERADTEREIAALREFLGEVESLHARWAFERPRRIPEEALRYLGDHRSDLRGMIADREHLIEDYDGAEARRMRLRDRVAWRDGEARGLG